MKILGLNINDINIIFLPFKPFLLRQHSSLSKSVSIEHIFYLPVLFTTMCDAQSSKTVSYILN